MSEILDKQLNVQKQRLKKLPGFMQAHKKVYDENESGRKNYYRIKFFVVKGKTL